MKGIVLIALFFTGFLLQSQTLIKSEWTPADKDSTSVVEIKAPMVYETIQLLAWEKFEEEKEMQCRAYLKFEILIDSPDTDTSIFNHLFRNWTKTIRGKEATDFYKIIDLYEYQIQFTK